jgi:hypothetical protein
MPEKSDISNLHLDGTLGVEPLFYTSPGAIIGDLIGLSKRTWPGKAESLREDVVSRAFRFTLAGGIIQYMCTSSPIYQLPSLPTFQPSIV